MMKDLIALYRVFWSQFQYNDLKPPRTRRKLPAFQDGFVRVNSGNKMEAPEFPYIVYQAPKPDFTESSFLQVSIWDRPPDGIIAVAFQDRLLSIIAQIEEEITADGAILPLKEGALQLRRGNPWVNIMEGDPSDPKITRAILNIIVDNYTL